MEFGKVTVPDVIWSNGKGVADKVLSAVICDETCHEVVLRFDTTIALTPG
jgi:hypothetical protein